MEFYYNKLIRDNIPYIIEESGNKCEFEIVSDEIALLYLYSKLTEEMNEFFSSKNLEEIADIIEVLYTLCDKMGYSREELEEIRKSKLKKNGGFDKNYILKKVWK